MSWATIRTGMETRLATISGLVAHPMMRETLPDKNIAVVLPGEPLIDAAGHGPYYWINVRVVVRVARATAEDAQAALDAYVWPSGANSIIAAVDADPTLAGTVDPVQFQRVANYGPSEGEQGKWQADLLFRMQGGA